MDAVCLFVFMSIIYTCNGFSGEITPYTELNDCEVNEYFDSVVLKCVKCDQQRYLQPSRDKLSCVCSPDSKIAYWDGASFPKCEKCPLNHTVTADGLECIPCTDQSTFDGNETSSCTSCSETKIRIEREVDGTLRKALQCIECATNTTPSLDQQSCVRCIRLPFREDCSCPQKTHETISKQHCIPRKALVDWPDERGTYTIEYESGVKIDSQFFRSNLRLASYQCKLKNHTACQAVANMCVMVMFREGYRGSPCHFFRDAKHIPTSDSGALPWLFYGEGDAQTVLSRRKISAVYSLDPTSRNNLLNLTLARYGANGRFLGLTPATVDMLQLCPGSWGSIRFGPHYAHHCQVPASTLLATGRQLQFLELYLQYWDKNNSQLYALPVLTLNIKDGTRYPNKELDKSGWLLVRRFFLVDAASGVSGVSEGEDISVEGTDSLPFVGRTPFIIRYAKSIHLKVKVQSGDEKGRVFPPLLEMEYGEISSESVKSNAMVSLSFSITYEMDNNMSHAIEVSIIVLSVLSLVWAGIQTLSYSRRAGQVGIDLVSLLRLALFACGRLADSFFLVAGGAAIHTFIFYKGQSVVHILLPGPEEEYIILTYVIVAFVLKVVEVVHMVLQQISIDVFLMDWERPRASGNIPRPQPSAPTLAAPAAPEAQKVSIWRTYFIANEWNEIQTLRKTSLAVQLLLMLLCLKVFRWEHWAVPSPSTHFLGENTLSNSPPNLVCRFALGVLVYIGLYLLQWLFMTGVYERFIKNFIQDFVDVCSMANVSVFILALENFGYYIHGRSVHGFADTDMQTMLSQLQREEDDLVGHRGLLPATEQQTFQMVVPPQLRACYRKVMAPLTVSIGPSTKRLSTVTGQRKALDTAVDRSVQAYHSMNKLLAAFLEHALKDLDYEVRNKLFLESVLDMEFAQAQDKGVLYIDNGHSFDAVLFYGNEWTLLTFDLMLFTFMELLCQNYLLAAIVTGLVAQTLVTLRRVGGRKNLAKKTLIDERFLI